MSLEQAVDAYLDQLPAAGKAPATCAAYASDLEVFQEYFGAQHPLSKVTSSKIDMFMEEQALAGASAATLRRRLSVIANLFRFWVKRKVLTTAPTDLVERVRTTEPAPRALPVATIEALLSETRGDKPTDLRDRLVLELLLSGARASEVASFGLAEAEAVLEKDAAALSSSQGDHGRHLPLGARARDALLRYLDLGRPNLECGETTSQGRLVLARTGAPLRRGDVWRIVQRTIDAAGLTEKISPKMLRQSFVQGEAGCVPEAAVE
jgi:integrase/recombinase XerD